MQPNPDVGGEDYDVIMEQRRVVVHEDPFLPAEVREAQPKNPKLVENVSVDEVSSNTFLQHTTEVATSLPSNPQVPCSHSPMSGCSTTTLQSSIQPRDCCKCTLQPASALQ
jgi:hypothetical protein